MTWFPPRKIDPNEIAELEAAYAWIVERAMRHVGQSMYVNGAGGYHPSHGPGFVVDVPWSKHGDTGRVGVDCSALLRYAARLKNPWPLLAEQPRGALVRHHINQDSALWDAEHEHLLFEEVDRPFAGCFLLYRSTYLDSSEPKRAVTSSRGSKLPVDKVRSGHAMIVRSVARVVEWDPSVFPKPWKLVDIVHARGPTGRQPGIVTSAATAAANHDAHWVRRPDMHTKIVRIRPDLLGTL